MIENSGVSSGNIDLTQPEETCRALGLCEEQSLAEYLLGEQPLNLEAIVEQVNSNPNSTWTAAAPSKFATATKNSVRKMMGTVVDPDWKVTLKEKTYYPEMAVPDNFDARYHWYQCEGVINHVRDQANCGSCWAHGTTEAFNDRLCIATNGHFQTLLSTADTAACCNGSQCFSFGCNGGQVGTPWAWFTRQGVVSGGDYGEGELCYDYTMPMCAHHVTVPGLTDCSETPTIDPICRPTCQTNVAIVYDQDKVKGVSSYSIKGVENIKKEIYEHGSITGAFTVYEDFLTYSSGVYYHQTGESHGGHAIKVIGWGRESGLEYWLCVNSWNNNWGMDGLFKIKMGDCGIDDAMHAGLAM